MEIVDNIIISDGLLTTVLQKKMKKKSLRFDSFIMVGAPVQQIDVSASNVLGVVCQMETFIIPAGKTKQKVQIPSNMSVIGLAWNGGDLLLADTKQSKIFKAQNQAAPVLLRSFQPENRIADIAIDKENLYFISMLKSAYIYYVNLGSTTTSAKQQFGVSKLDTPEFIAASRNIVAVTESGKGCVRVFDSVGKDIVTLTTANFIPKGIAIYDSQHIFVANADQKNITVFHLSGDVLQTLSATDAKGKEPLGLAFSPKRTVMYVSYNGVKNLHKYKLDEA